MKTLEIYYKQVTSRKRKFAKYLCDCGNVFEARVDSVDSGKIVSCGCYNKKLITKHNLAWKHPLYKKWLAIKNRCNNPNYTYFKNYGGRGIKVCNEWLDNFQSFYNWAVNNGWSEGLQIDRIDSNGNYQPSNCQFITAKENLRKTTKTILDVHIAKEIRQLKKLTDLSNKEIASRLNISLSNVKSVLYSGAWS